MSNFPTNYDDDVTLPPINDNINDIGGEAINALRDATFNIETNIGLDAQGSTASISERLGISIEQDGTIKPSALTSLGLVTLPITNSQISDTAQIVESKLSLDHATQDLYNYITYLAGKISSGLGWISTTGVKLDPHLMGFAYKHTLGQIVVNNDTNLYFKNKFGAYRDNTNSFTALNDLNSEVTNHQILDGIVPSIINVTTINGLMYPSNYAHTSSGIFLNTDRFSVVPQTATDLQQFADFIDSSSIFLYGSRVQNLYSNGISRSSRSSSLVTDGYGTEIIPVTSAIAYLFGTGGGNNPLDDIDTGDDIIAFQPTAGDISTNSFDEKFALVKTGDILRINYGTVEVAFVIKEKKYTHGNYSVRINGKNLLYTASATARIDRPLLNKNKYGVLSLSAANNNFSSPPSLIVGSPKGAQVLGVGFNADKFNTTNYLLYLVLYPDGSPQNGVVLPAIDVTGNAGITPGKYTLESIIEATNNAFRQPGYNYRFTAFSYGGEFGIMLSDSYNNASFSIINMVVASDGSIDYTATNNTYPNNVISLYPLESDPLGFGVSGANIASPIFKTSYGSPEAALYPTKIFVPLKRNNFYVNGVERDKLAIDTNQFLDGYGDGYWPATVYSKTTPSNQRVEITYRIPYDLSASYLAVGKTVVIQSLGAGGFVDFGRFTIKSISAGCNFVGFTELTVFDAVHANGSSPATVLDVGSTVAIYFGADSVSFNDESMTDFTTTSPFKRFFEVYVDQNGKTFSHERARINISGANTTVNGITLYQTSAESSKINLIDISSKLRGYQFNTVNKITLYINNYSDTTGNYDGYLCLYNGSNITNAGPTTYGRKGEITRFYDETNIDYVDILFDINLIISNFNTNFLDIQLFPTLSLDEELMLLGTCQLNDTTYIVNYINNKRQFGNVGEKDLTTSALNYISLPDKLLHSNGVIRGFDIVNISYGSSDIKYGQINLNGGTALVNGKIIYINNNSAIIPLIKEKIVSFYNINWAVCINDKSEYTCIPLLDYDTSFGTPNNINRTFHVYNVANGSEYYLDASTFSNIINNRKDLTILYIARSEVTIGSPSTISVTTTDARKYATDADNSLPLKFTPENSQGNFRKLDAILNWVKYNNSYNGDVILNGLDVDNGIVSSNIVLDFSNMVNIDGLSNAILTFNGLVTLGSNITFKNSTINFNGGVTPLNSASNILFENCDITYVAPASPSNNAAFNFVGGNKITFKDCTISATYTVSPTNNTRAIFKFNNTANFSMLNTDFTVSFTTTSGYASGNIFNFVSSDNATIKDCTFNGSFNQFVYNSLSDNVKIMDCSVTSTYTPTTEFSYDTTNLVNSGNGWIYSNVIESLSNFCIDNVTFNYNPIVGSTDRFSFINFELSTSSSVLRELKITNCKFNNLNDTVFDGSIDNRAAIAIINTAPASVSTSTPPVLYNADISNNICSKRQSIIITSTIRSNIMKYPGLSTYNVTVSNNTCGTIGYWVCSGLKTGFTIPNTIIYSDKTVSLVIKENDCYSITNLDHTGKYFLVSAIVSGNTTNMCEYASGYVTLYNNRVNWIHTAIAYEQNSSLHIKDNILTNNYPYDLDRYGDTASYSSVNGSEYSYDYAIFVDGNKAVISSITDPTAGNDSSCIISGNIIDPGYISFANMVYKAAISNNCSAIIENNIIKGISNGATLPIIRIGGMHNTVTQNNIYKYGIPIDSYIKFIKTEVPVWDGYGSTAIITDNYLDSPYINDISLDTNTIVKSGAINSYRYIVERNINQTGTYILQAYDMNHSISNVSSRFYFANSPATSSTIYNVTSIAKSIIWYYNNVPTKDSFRSSVNLYELLPKNVNIVDITTTYSASAVPDTNYTLTFSLTSTNGGTDAYNETNLDTSENSTILTPLVSHYHVTNDTVLFTINADIKDTTVSSTITLKNITINYRW